MTVPAVISLITLGVHDVRASTAFYESLGFELSSSSIEGEVSFFHMAGAALGLYGIDDLAADAQSIPSSGDGFGGVTLAVNVGSPAAVDAALGAAEAAGATIPRKGQTADWGGYSGYFADPDGHLWEVAYNPFWPLDGNGVPQLP